MSTILLLGIVMFACSSLYFWFNYKKDFNSAFFVSFVTLVSYVIMFDGRFVTGGTENGLYWTRWVFYGISCSLLTYEITRQLKLSRTNAMTAIALTPIVMFTGALASVYADLSKWLMFGISSVAFLMIGWLYWQSKSPELPRIKLYFLLGWSVFPVVFLLSPEGLVTINNNVSASIYLAIDLFTKIIFYLQYQAKQKKY